MSPESGARHRDKKDRRDGRGVDWSCNGRPLQAHWSFYSMSPLINPMSQFYQCVRCANCCRWRGFVKIEEDDIAAMSQFFGISSHDFIQRYTRLRQYRDGLALLDKPDGACIFLDGIDCKVQPVKPKQCIGFPNTWNFPGWEKVCRAVPV